MAPAQVAAIDIRPPTSVYATFRRLSYDPWYAIAEFVDNSTQSYFDHEAELKAVFKRKKGRLRVEVSYDLEQEVLTVYDNAYGMEEDELRRALVLNTPPPDPSGRSEFGMGLKTAASWFGDCWTIESSQLGSGRRLSATVDIDKLEREASESVPVEVSEAEPNEHYTRLTIHRVRHPIRGRTTGRVLDELGSIYRQDLRSGEIEILWNSEPVRFDEPSILEETLNDGTERRWRKDIRFKVSPPDNGDALLVHGWIALRDPGSQRDAGLVLLRRGRVIVGGPGQGYKPEEVFGKPNLYRSQRLIGELHMDNWPVTQAKDSFDWSGGLEDRFIDALKPICKKYGDYAEAYRSGRGPKQITPEQMRTLSKSTREVISDPRFGDAVSEALRRASQDRHQEDGQQQSEEQGTEEEQNPQELKAESQGPVTYTLRVGSTRWVFRLHWREQQSGNHAHWMQLSYGEDNDVDVFLDVGHPFFAPYLDQKGAIQLLQKLVIALALAEHMARSTSTNGQVMPEDFRNYMNIVLRRASEIEGSLDGG